MAHLVITIGCEYGAKGNQIGRRVAEDLGIKFYDRETVDEIIKEVGIPKDIMEKVEQGVTIAGKGAEGDTRGAFSKYADLTERAIHVQKTIIRKLADRESCVIIGRSADYILKEQKPILRVFIYAPDEVRIENVMKSHNLSADDARLLIEEKDKRYHKRHPARTAATATTAICSSTAACSGRTARRRSSKRSRGRYSTAEEGRASWKRSNPNLTRCSAHGTSSSSRSAQ